MKQRECGDDQSPYYPVAVKNGRKVGKLRNVVRTNHRMTVLHIALFKSAHDYSSVAQ